MSDIIPFDKYNFDADENFKQYFTQIDFPADSSEASQLEVGKQKYYKSKIDSNFKVTAKLERSNRPYVPPYTNSSSNSQSNNNQQQNNNNYQQNNQNQNYNYQQNNNNQQNQQNQQNHQNQNQRAQDNSFVGKLLNSKYFELGFNFFILLNALLFLVGFTNSYARCLLAAMLIYIISATKTVHKPPTGWFSKELLPSLFKDVNVQYVYYCLIFSAASPKFFYLMPISIYAFMFVSSKIVNFPIAHPLFNTVKAFLNTKVLRPSQRDIFLLTVSQIEVFLLLLVILDLFVSGSLFTVITYYNFLKYRHFTSNFSSTVNGFFLQKLDGFFLSAVVPAVVQNIYRKLRF